MWLQIDHSERQKEEDVQYSHPRGGEPGCNQGHTETLFKEAFWEA